MKLLPRPLPFFMETLHQHRKNSHLSLMQVRLSEFKENATLWLSTKKAHLQCTIFASLSRLSFSPKKTLDTHLFFLLVPAKGPLKRALGRALALLITLRAHSLQDLVMSHPRPSLFVCQPLEVECLSLIQAFGVVVRCSPNLENSMSLPGKADSRSAWLHLCLGFSGAWSGLSEVITGVLFIYLFMLASVSSSSFLVVPAYCLK